ALVAHGEELPGAGHPFELVLSTVLEIDSGPSNQVCHRSRNQDLVRLCGAAYPRSRVHSDARDVFISLLDFSDVDPAANRHADLDDAIRNGLGGADGGCRPVECCEDTVTGRFHEPAAEP